MSVGCYPFLRPPHVCVTHTSQRPKRSTMMDILDNLGIVFPSEKPLFCEKKKRTKQSSHTCTSDDENEPRRSRLTCVFSPVSLSRLSLAVPLGHGLGLGEGFPSDGVPVDVLRRCPPVLEDVEQRCSIGISCLRRDRSRAFTTAV